ncbi:MAG: hypothetical protein ABW212_05600 [Pseudonocardia sediminis]
MSVPEEVRTRLATWCSDLVGDHEQGRRRIGYTTTGSTITILDRRPPTFPELGAAWSSTALAQLRVDTPEPGRWSLFLPGREPESRWERQEPSADDPFLLLERIEGAIRSVGPG